MAKIIRYSKLLDEYVGDNVFDCSRPNVLSNPFTHIKNKKTLAKKVVDTREEAVRLYEIYFDEMISKNQTFKDEFERIYKAYNEYDTIYLGCYCNPEKEKCHTEIIEKKLLQRALKDKIQEEYRKRKEQKAEKE